MSEAVKTKVHEITIHPQQERLEAKKGLNLYRFLTSSGYTVPSACGGMGICGKCRVLIHAGRKPPTESERIHLLPEELTDGWRLSCQQRIDRDMTIEIPQVDESTQAKEDMSRPCHVKLQTGVEKTYLQLQPPGRDDQRPDTVRVQDAVNKGRLAFPISVLQKLPSLLRESDYRVTLTRKDEQVIDIEAGDTSSASYGVAFDIGTTTIAGYLLDLRTGEDLVIRSQMNPQQRFGADVISRIKCVRDRGEEGLEELQRAISTGLNMITRQLILAAKIPQEHIYNISIVGNPTMIHLLMGVDPRGIDHSPYIPVLRDEAVVPARRIGLEVNPEGNVWLLPAVSGYVGSDITAGILYTGLHQMDGLNLFVDMGTNAEIVLGNRDRLMACSTPAGPAFEGAGIRYGMRATPGAISHVRLKDNDVSLQVIGQGVPKGICGSGLIDAAAELIRSRHINDKGKMLDSPGLAYPDRVDHDDKGQARFLLTNGTAPIYITQGDVRELQLAKGAIQAGVESLLKVWGASVDDVDRIFLAGAFGSYVRRESVLQIGMLPPFPEQRIHSVGNAAGQGAKLGLLSRAKWEEVQALVERIEYFELSYYKEFSDIYMQSMLFPKQ